LKRRRALWRERGRGRGTERRFDDDRSARPLVVRRSSPTTTSRTHRSASPPPLTKNLTNRTWLLAALALAAVVLALSAARADAAKAASPASAVEQYTALAKEYVAKAQKLAEEISAQAQETVSWTSVVMVRRKRALLALARAHHATKPAANSQNNPNHHITHRPSSTSSRPTSTFRRPSSRSRPRRRSCEAFVA
jgi:Tfp pilus assembly protein PilE